MTNKKHLFIFFFFLASFVQAQVKVAIFSLNDFHGAFVRNDYKGIVGAPSIKQTLDSLKKVYPLNITVSAGDNFGGSYFYNATNGVLLPVFFNELGIRISAVGNHEFDDGQLRLGEKWKNSPLRPKNWDITYVCSNIRSTETGQIPNFCQPIASVPLTLPNGKEIRIAFAGLIASSTPLQASKSKLAGLSFDGKYTRVLDSLLAQLENSLINEANVRILLTHIGSKMDKNNAPQWDDMDAYQLEQVNSPIWHGILSSHSHQPVCGRINKAAYPIVQGKWHGDYISMLLCTIDTVSLKLTNIEPKIIRVFPKDKLEKEPARLQAQIDSLLLYTKTAGGTPLGEVLTEAHVTLLHDRDDKYRQSEIGSLVCQAYAEAYRNAAKLSDEDVVIGCSHFGSIRAGFVKGPVSVLDVGEALPFSNALKAYSLTGEQLKKLVDFGLHNEKFGWLQTSWLDIEQNTDTRVENLTYVSPNGKRIKIKGKKRYILVADEFITTGGDGYAPSFFPTEQEIKDVILPATTDAFINYLRQKDSI